MVWLLKNLLVYFNNEMDKKTILELLGHWFESSCQSCIKGIVLAKNENSVIIYSPFTCSKPLWVSFFCWTHKLTHTHARTHICTHTHMHARTHAHTYARTHACTHTHICTHTHTHAHMHARTHAHTHMFLWKVGTFHGRKGFILYKLYVLLPYTYPLQETVHVYFLKKKDTLYDL